ncbi:MAG: phosphatidylserine decarboxylase family protein [Bacteroidales bacterium]|jgi:phosphatidylserine decarboxylase|nr:phosphatidylserine decarboxylase family protein [Bacteroidales bacterium]
MKIHKEGVSILIILFIVLLGVNLAVYYLVGANTIYNWLTCIITIFLYGFVGFFFRKPNRSMVYDENKIFAPADGTVVVVEQTHEEEYFKDQRIQVSIFMSVWNIHINWFPIGGLIKYFKYHPGRFLVARLPKSSTQNERTTVVIEDQKKRQLLVRQIAGIVARRIISYVKNDGKVKQNAEMGFIRFGSRLDVFLPLDAKVKVKPGEKTRGSQTVIAEFND